MLISPGNLFIQVIIISNTQVLILLITSSCFVVVYLLANVILMGWVGVMRNPCNAIRASVACSSVANSTKAMSVRDGTSLTSCKPGNLQKGEGGRVQQ